MDKIVPRHQRPTRLETFLFGAPYYPEHWTEADRADDPQRMAAAGVNIVRMAEFAWDRIEPERGRFDFSLFDDTIERLGAVGIDAILCTPTAAPPRWLTIGNKDWLRVDEKGVRMSHGSRQHCCTNNEDFRAESRRITKAMAEHYAANPRVVGWQTDNEFYCHFTRCYCDACVHGFQEWLRQKYATIDKLNAAWGTAFWALTFQSFDQVPLPFPGGCPAHPNPSHELDHYRYLSDSIIEFQRQQVEILRAANPDWWITHNGLFGYIDYWRFTEDLDFLSVDIYPGFGVKNPADSAGPAIFAERCRACTGGFIVPEQQGGPGGQRPYIHPTPAPGQMRLWAYQSIAHGSDGILHFRWRTCRFGAEEYWNGILGHDNIPRRRYEEFAREGAELKRIGAKILGTVLDVKAAVLIESDQDNAHVAMPLGLPSPIHQSGVAYRELWRRHLPCGLVHAQDSFDGLKLLVLPSMPMMDEALAAKLTEFVTGGGVLVVTAQSAIHNRDHRVISETAPGLIAELCGARVEEFGKIDAGSLSLLLDESDVPSGGWYEILSLHGAGLAARWKAPRELAQTCAANAHPAITLHRVGRGAALYVGTFLTDDNVRPILELARLHVLIEPLAACADFVEITRRRAVNRRLTFVLNHYPQKQAVTDLPPGTELITGRRCAGELELGPYGVAVIEEE